jgi:hypothetical protein
MKVATRSAVVAEVIELPTGNDGPAIPGARWASTSGVNDANRTRRPGPDQEDDLQP